MAQERVDLRVVELNEAAESLPQGNEREALLNKARRMEAASNVIDKWLSSPGLRAPR
jgi:hypothetical protein